MAGLLSTLRQHRATGPVLWFFWMILLGALGSAFWELFLRHVLASVGQAALTLTATAWGGYVDVLHRDIGKLSPDGLVVPMFIGAAVAVIVTPVFLIHRLLRDIAAYEDASSSADSSTLSAEEMHVELQKMRDSVQGVRKRMIRVWMPLAFVSGVLYALIAWQVLYTRGASNWAERAIEILRPQLSVEQHMKLRSNLRAVSSARQFYELEAELRRVADNTHTELPPFSSIRRRGQ